MVITSVVPLFTRGYAELELSRILLLFMAVPLLRVITSILLTWLLAPQAPPYATSAMV